MNRFFRRTLNQFVNINCTVILLFLFSVNAIAADTPVQEILKKGREQFYAAVKDEKQIEPTIKLFERIAFLEPKHSGTSQVYIGALVALKGKHAFFPHTKLKWVKRGLSIMDSGLKKNPNNIEALFIHGMTCYYLPFFFRRSDDAQRNFKEIIKQMPLERHAYSPKLIRNVVAFLLEHAKLTTKEKIYLQSVKSKLRP